MYPNLALKWPLISLCFSISCSLSKQGEKTLLFDAPTSRYYHPPNNTNVHSSTIPHKTSLATTEPEHDPEPHFRLQLVLASSLPDQNGRHYSSPRQGARCSHAWITLVVVVMA
jgi:hypothetical protein